MRSSATTKSSPPSGGSTNWRADWSGTQAARRSMCSWPRKGDARTTMAAEACSASSRRRPHREGCSLATFIRRSRENGSPAAIAARAAALTSAYLHREPSIAVHGRRAVRRDGDRRLKLHGTAALGGAGILLRKPRPADVEPEDVVLLVVTRRGDAERERRPHRMV